ncbi:MAG: hypothetical protein ABXS91_04780 [Sulfurimonas sp.]
MPAIIAGVFTGSILLHGGILSIYDPFLAKKDQKTLTLDSQILLSNDAFSLEALFDDFHGKYIPGDSDNTAIGDIRVDAGSIIEGWGYIGYSYRKEAVIKSTPDSMKFLYQVSNDLDLFTGEHYDAFILLKGFETHGIEFSNTYPLYSNGTFDIRIGYGVELMIGTEGQNGYVTGDASAVSTTDYDFNLNSRYYYTQNYLYDYDVDYTSAYGFSTQLAMLFTYDNFALKIIGNDVLGKLYWKNIPYSEVNLVSENKSYDENGYAEYSPTISGLERQQRYIQRLMPKWRFETSYEIEGDLVQVGFDYIEDMTLPYVSYRYEINDRFMAKLSYEHFFGMFGLDLTYEDYRIEICTNKLIEPSAAKLSFGYLYRY